MFLTKSEHQAIAAVFQFWDQHKKSAPQSWRNQLVENFIAEWTGRVNLTKPLMRHPDTRKKNYKREFSIMDILTDFILSVDQVEERKKEYPIQNEEKRLRVESRSKELERSIIFDEEMPDSTDEYTVKPPYSIEERAFNSRNPIEEIFFAESRLETVEELIGEIEKIKRNEDFYIDKYTDVEKKRTPAIVRKAIRELDSTRVTQCLECGTAFYTHDRRRKVCDTQKYPNSNLSACEVNFHRKREETRYLAQKKSIL